MSRRSVSALTAAVMAAAALSGCGTTEQKTPESAYSSAPASSASPSSAALSTKRPAPGPAMPAAVAALAAAYGDLNRKLSGLGANQKVALAIVPVGDPAADPIIFGDNTPPQVAWSSIKVPLAVAAERNHGGMMPATVAAITASDNGAAQSLWDSLGTNEQAAAAVTAVLREAGDRQTRVPATAKRPPYTIFGQTVWGVDSSVRFTAGFACLPDGARVRQLMGRVAGNQQWGAERMKSRTEVKGGWGPGVDGGYVVRQIALITHRGGAQTAVSMVTFGSGTTMDSGIVALNHVGAWLSQNAKNLPRGYC